MKLLLRQAVDQALSALAADAGIAADELPAYQIETPRQASHGDYSTNLAMQLARVLKRKPRDIAADLAAMLGEHAAVASVEVAGPGFINFTLADNAVFAVVPQILELGTAYGRNNSGAGRRVQVEFVSANPTGPLHVGHGRGAAIGSAIAALLEASGFAVTREYYVNDAGRQMDILALSVYLRYREHCGHAVGFPDNAYQGDYIRDIATRLAADVGTGWVTEATLDHAHDAQDDADRRLDRHIALVREALGEDRYGTIKRLACNHILDGIRDDLAAFGVTFDNWYSEASLADAGLIDDAIGVLERGGHLYVADGATWFRSAALGDEKDRVVVRDNGHKTYFASDIAYHLDKFRRGFDAVVDVWGADHHGYVPRVRAAIEALGEEPQRLDVVLVQFAALVRGGEKVAMSTRSGEFVTLRELVDEVGADAARFFYVMRRADQHLEFDLDLAKAQNNDNPVYYVQYAHARICSVYRQLADRGLAAPATHRALDASLREPAERQLAMTLAAYPDVVAAAAAAREPHQLTQYLRDLAHELHGFYNAHKVLVDDPALRDARLVLLAAVRQVLANGLSLLNISCPETM